MHDKASQYRQGDILLESIEDLPKGDLVAEGKCILAEGEVTGHAHIVKEGGRLYSEKGTLFLVVIARTAELVHPEHAAIILPRGSYVVRRQREYVPARNLSNYTHVRGD